MVTPFARPLAPTLKLKCDEYIRSFVRREGRITAAQAILLKEQWSSYGLELNETIWNFKEIFKREASVVMEIGFGDGRSLIKMAEENPHLDFIGVEVYRTGVAKALQAIWAQKLTNIRLVCADAVEVLKKSIAAHSLQQVQLYFPDPWPKKRHHKRRLVQPAWVDLVAGCLKPGACFHMATDWEPYATEALLVLESSTYFMNKAGQGNFSLPSDYRSETKFEARGKKLGHGIWELLFTRTELS